MISNSTPNSFSTTSDQPSLPPTTIYSSSFNASTLKQNASPTNRLKYPKIPSYLVDSSYADWVYDKVDKGDGNGREMFLPTAWNFKERNALIEVSNCGLKVTYTGPGKSENDIAAIRANHHMPVQCGLFYFEVEILNKGKEGLIGIGFCGVNVKLNRLPGWETNSWGYHGDDGLAFSSSGTGAPYGPKFTTGDVIGCGVNFRTNTAFYTKNGSHLGTAFKEFNDKIYPCVGLRTQKEAIQANFGGKPFKFDIMHYMEEEKAKLWGGINSIKLSLPPPSSSNSTRHGGIQVGERVDQTGSIINMLVTSYLVHHGYSATAKSFVKNSMGIDPSQDNSSMEMDPIQPPGTEAFIAERIKSELGDDKEEDIINRQDIRDHVLNGEIDMAITLTERFYPDVLSNNPDILFQLKCRKFIEMIRQLEESYLLSNSILVASDDTNHLANAIGSPEKRKREVMDDHLTDDDSGEFGAVDISRVCKMKDKRPSMQIILLYGQELQEQYGDSDSQEIKNTLLETFSLLAYKEASKSVVAYLLDRAGREPVANKLNSAILVSQNRPPIPTLELIFRQSCVTTKHLVDNHVGDGPFINVHKDCLL